MTEALPATSPGGVIAALESPRPDLLVFAISGRIEEPDIEWMARRSEAAFRHEDEVDMLILIRDWEGSSLGAILDGEALGVQAEAVAKVRRYAVVGAPKLARAMIEATGWLSPVEAKTFDLGEEAKARDFVGA